MQMLILLYYVLSLYIWYMYDVFYIFKIKPILLPNYTCLYKKNVRM